MSETATLDLGDGKRIAVSVAGPPEGYDAAWRQSDAELKFDELVGVAEAMIDKFAGMVARVPEASEVTVGFSVGVAVEGGKLVAALLNASAEIGVTVEIKWGVAST